MYVLVAKIRIGGVTAGDAKKRKRCRKCVYLECLHTHEPKFHRLRQLIGPQETLSQNTKLQHAKIHRRQSYVGPPCFQCTQRRPPSPTPMTRGAIQGVQLRRIFCFISAKICRVGPISATFSLRHSQCPTGGFVPDIWRLRRIVLKRTGSQKSWEGVRPLDHPSPTSAGQNWRSRSHIRHPSFETLTVSGRRLCAVPNIWRLRRIVVQRTGAKKSGCSRTRTHPEPQAHFVVGVDVCLCPYGVRQFVVARHRLLAIILREKKKMIMIFRDAERM